MPHQHKIYILPLFQKSHLIGQLDNVRKLSRMLILLYCLLFVGLIIFANASRQLGPWTACREREDQYCLRTAIVWAVVSFFMLCVFICAGFSIFTVDQSLKCGCFDEGHILRSVAAMIVLSFIVVVIFFSYGSFQVGRDFASFILKSNQTDDLH